jgi:hypothetical protein
MTRLRCWICWCAIVSLCAPCLVASGISKHLMNLRAAGLVRAERQGRQQIYRLQPDALAAALAPWIAKYEQYWSAALERLRGLAQEDGSDQT